MKRRAAFTLLEVLVSVTLLSLVLLGLYQSLEVQRRSNLHLHETLTKTLQEDRAVMTLYQDLLACDGRTGVISGEFDRLCIPQTSHSLYGLSQAAVCWLVSKPDRDLLRVEGVRIHLPLKLEDRVAVDRVLKGVQLFRIYRERNKVLVVLKTGEGKEYAFMVQGIAPPEEPKRKPPDTEANRTVQPPPERNETKP